MKTLINADPDFKAYTCDPGEQIDLSHLSKFVELRATEIHIKPDATLDNKPGILIVLQHPDNLEIAIIGQISLEMLKPVIAKLKELEHAGA